MVLFTIVKSATLLARDLSLSPCGERFGEREVPLLGKRGRGVVKSFYVKSKNRQWLTQKNCKSS